MIALDGVGNTPSKDFTFSRWNHLSIHRMIRISAITVTDLEALSHRLVPDLVEDANELTAGSR